MSLFFTLLLACLLQPCRASGRLFQIVGNSQTSFSGEGRSSCCARFTGGKASKLLGETLLHQRSSSSKAGTLILHHFPTRIKRRRRGPLSHHPPCRLRDLISFSRPRFRRQPLLQLLQFSCAMRTRGCVKTTVCSSPRFLASVACMMKQCSSFSSDPAAAARLCMILRG